MDAGGGKGKGPRDIRVGVQEGYKSERLEKPLT